MFDADHYIVVPFYSFLHWEYAKLADDFKCADEAARGFVCLFCRKRRCLFVVALVVIQLVFFVPFFLGRQGLLAPLRWCQ